MKSTIREPLRRFAVAAALAVGAHAAHAEDIVIALKSNPLVDPEPACVAVQIGINLLSEIDGTSADRVTLFPTLDGVEIVGERMLPNEELPNGRMKNYPPHLDCLTPSGYVPLPVVLANFAAKEGAEIIVCPLCWGARYPGEMPIYGSVGNASSIHSLFLDASKVIDF